MLPRERYRLPSFEQLNPSQAKELGHYTTRAAYKATREDAAFGLARLHYSSDGLRVVAYLYSPTTPPARPLPLLIYNRGSWVAGDEAPVLAPLFRRLARAGFVVLAPQYRGSDGGEGRDEMGGADVNDVVNLLPLAARLPSADTSRIFMYRESCGGMMTMQAIRRRMPVRAGATVGAFSDLEATMAADERRAKRHGPSAPTSPPVADRSWSPARRFFGPSRLPSRCSFCMAGTTRGCHRPNRSRSRPGSRGWAGRTSFTSSRGEATRWASARGCATVL